MSSPRFMALLCAAGPPLAKPRSGAVGYPAARAAPAAFRSEAGGSPQIARGARLELYFAYGSNLLESRMAERVPGALCRGRAWLPDHRLVFDKRGRDGSAKANLRREPGQRVWGVVYALGAEDWPRLDCFEAGYRRLPMEVWMETRDGESAATAVQTYQSDLRVADERPLSSYLRLVIAGARQRGLPAESIAALERVERREGA